MRSTELKDRHGRGLRLKLYGDNGEAGELAASALKAVLRVRRDLPRLARKPAFSSGTGLSKSLCDWVVERLLGFIPVKAELQIQHKGAVFFYVPADLGNFLNDINGIIIRDQYNAFCVEDKVVADAGANIGVFTLYALALGAKKVYAFEAVKETFDLLKRNLALNHAGRAAKAVNVALGARSGKAALKFNPNGEGCSMIKNAAAEVNRGLAYSGTRTVKISALDALVKGRVDFIKIDVEGYEEEVILGASGIVKKYKPVLSFSAYHRNCDRKKLPEVVRSLRKDYRITLNFFDERDFYCE
jgi:FkbM family methyltransferase